MKEKPIITAQQAADMIPDGAVIFAGGFLGCGQAHGVIEALAASGKGHFTLIANDMAREVGPGGEAHFGIAKLIQNRQVSRVISSHVGMTPEVGRQANEGILEVDLVPQGTLAEMIRAGGAGLGGVLTPVGIGTVVEDSPFTRGKMTLDGKDYLLMKSLRANVALLGGYKTDKVGNVWYKGTMRNFNVPMATAADLVIVESEYIVQTGKLDAENVHTHGILVDYIVGKESA